MSVPLKLLKLPDKLQYYNIGGGGVSPPTTTVVTALLTVL
jgi:hypothetical protein